jgi:alpha-glucosidase
MLLWKYLNWSVISVATLVAPAFGYAQGNPLEVSSPDHRITLRFSVKAAGQPAAAPEGQLVYSVEFRGRQVFEDSALRLELVNQPPQGAAVHIAGTTA